MTAKNTSVSLGEHFSSFIEAQVAEGRYNSASDVVRAALPRATCGLRALSVRLACAVLPTH